MKFELTQYHRNTPEEEFLEDIRKVARKLGKDTVTTSEYSEHGKYHPTTIRNRTGSWLFILEKAGLSPSSTKRNISDDDLFINIRNIWVQLERQPNCKDLKKPLSKYSERPYRRRFGTWQQALQAFIEYIDSPNSDRPQQKDECVSTKKANASVRKTRKTKRTISDRLRFSILLRDGFRCQSCGSSPLSSPGTELHVDHIIPWSKGGETLPDNLQTKCKRCNLGKGNVFNK